VVCAWWRASNLIGDRAVNLRYLWRALKGWSNFSPPILQASPLTNGLVGSTACSSRVAMIALLLFFLLPTVGVGRAAHAQCGGRWLSTPAHVPNGINGPVKSVVIMPNGDIVVGGSFSIAGGATANCIARWDGNAWSPLGSGMSTGFPLSVNALAVLPNGDLIAGGSFANAGGVLVRNVARWNGSTWSALGSGIGGTSAVNALAVLPNGDVIAGGAFSGKVARWDGASWRYLGSGINDVVYALAALPNGDFVAGGAFTLAGGTVASRVARWDGVAWQALGSGVIGDVRALALFPNGHVVAAGGFAIAGGVSAHYVARWDGETWSPLGGGVNDLVLALAVLPGGELAAGGYFTSAGGSVAAGIARWDGASWVSFGGQIAGGVAAIAAGSNGRLVVGGSFTSPGGHVAELRNSSWDPLGEGLDAGVDALLVEPGGGVIAGGFFTTGGAGVARWDGTRWMPLGSGVDGFVKALAFLPNGDLVAAGMFTTAGGASANNVARWDGTTWHPLGLGVNDIVESLAVMPNGDLVAGGYFTSAGGVTANRIAKWNGRAWGPLGSGIDNSMVLSLAVMPNGDLVAGGKFSGAGGVSTGSMARWNGSAWSSVVNSTVYTPYDEVSDLALAADGRLFAGGNLGFGSTRYWIYSADGSTLPSAWSPVGQGLKGSVYAVLGLRSGHVVAGGFFTNATPCCIAVNGIARWDGTAWSPMGAGMNVGSAGPLTRSVSDLAVLPNGDIVAGGSFTTAGGLPSGFWGYWTETGAPWVARQPSIGFAAANAVVEFSAASAAGFDFAGPVAFRWRRDGLDISDGSGGASQGGGTVVGSSGFLTATDTYTKLVIFNAQESDEGAYSVVFSNSCGAVASETVSFRFKVDCVGDLNGDGMVGGADLGVVLGAWGAVAGASAADLNQDGFVSGLDLGLLLGAWGACGP
jgi:WD40 repeat protein